MTLRSIIIPVTAFQQNCSLVWCPITQAGAVIDPGGDLEHILARVAEEGVELTKILLTHAHIDHAGATQVLSENLGLPIEGPHPDDQFWIDLLPEQARMFGFSPVAAFTPTRWLSQGDRVEVGRETLEVYHCPGHTPGHVVFHSREARLAFVGDVLFAGSIGRTDFPGEITPPSCIQFKIISGPWATMSPSFRAMALPPLLGGNGRLTRWWAIGRCAAEPSHDQSRQGTKAPTTNSAVRRVPRTGTCCISAQPTNTSRSSSNAPHPRAPSVGNIRIPNRRHSQWTPISRPMSPESNNPST